MTGGKSSVFVLAGAATGAAGVELNGCRVMGGAIGVFFSVDSGS